MAPEQVSLRWTRQAEGSYIKEGTLPADIPTARIFAIDEDYKTNPNAVCPGLKLRAKEEAIDLVERKIAEGSYRGWRFEIRPEVSSDDIPTASAKEPLESPAFHSCHNPRCKKGPNGTRGIVKSQRAKYCCGYCRVAVCRRSRPKPEQFEKHTRKRRRDAKYNSHSERQRAYQARHRPYPLPEAIKDCLAIKAGRAGVVGKRVLEPV